MSEELLKSIQDMLTEEKWTRAAISNYTKNHFQKLGTVVEDAKRKNCVDAVKESVDEHLTHTKNSIIGLYLSGMLSLAKRTLDDSALVTLVNIFLDNHKTDIVVYLCETILAEDENNKFALRTLAEYYKAENNERMWEIYETLVKIDHDEADLAKTLAEKYEKDGDMETAIEFYKKALLRYVNKNLSTQIKETWTKLVSLIPEEFDFFFLVQSKIAKTISEDKSALLMHELYDYYKDNHKWDTAIKILKLILSYDEKDSWARKEIVECFRGKYANHSQLEDYIRVSNITQSWRRVFEAISDFEKHIAFDAKNFVFHRSWGVGIIRKVENDEITINFGKPNGIHKMSLKMAVDALMPLDRNHIWVLKATKSKAELVDLVKNYKVEALKIIIQSFNNSCDFKKIKAELVPTILEAKEWTSWSTAARKILDENPCFGVNANDISAYTVRENAITQEEKLANEFKAQKNFFPRVDIFMRYANDDETDKTSEYFAEMFNYFTSYLKSINTVDEKIVASYLVVNRIKQTITHLQYDFTFSFSDLFKEIKKPREIYNALKDTKNTSLKKDFISQIKMLENWADIYINLFPCVLQQSIIDVLLTSGNTEKLKQLALGCFENYRDRDNREAVIFFFKESQNEDWFKELNLSYDKQVITLINILDLTYREIENHYETTENRKVNRQIQKLLFDSDTLLKYLLESDINTITRLYTLVDDVKDLDSLTKTKMRNKILEKFPDFKFFRVEEKVAEFKGLWVTGKMLEKKRAELEHIATVLIPENSKEIGEAAAKGDLKENAEYHAARERQKELNAKAAELERDTNRAQAFDPTTITKARISFGNIVTLVNDDTGEKNTCTILGPWESDVENGIISYLTPKGRALLGAKVGDKVSWSVQGETYNCTVEDIDIAKF